MSAPHRFSGELSQDNRAQPMTHQAADERVFQHMAIPAAAWEGLFGQAVQDKNFYPESPVRC